jgi:hypothetical protein
MIGPALLEKLVETPVRGMNAREDTQTVPPGIAVTDSTVGRPAPRVMAGCRGKNPMENNKDKMT